MSEAFHYDIVGGVTTTTGTGSYSITGPLDGFSPFSDVPNSTEITVYVRLGSHYELVTGVISGSGTSLTRATVRKSSNSNNAVNWIAGTKTMILVARGALLRDMANMVEAADAKVMTAAERAAIAALGNSSTRDVGTTAGTVAAGDDARLAGVDLDSFDPADPLDGTEIFPALQSGNAVAPTAEEIAGKPLTVMLAHGRNRLRGCSDLLGTPFNYVTTTNNGLFGVDPVEVWMSGTGAQVSQGSGTLFRYGVARCETGTTTTGRAAATSTIAPIFINAAGSILDFGILAALSNAPTGAQDFTAQIGVFTSPTALATQGLFFRAVESQANWQAVSKNGSGETTTDTGIARDTTWRTFKISYDFNTGNAVFTIGSSVVATHSTNIPGIIAMHIGVSIHKSAGTTNRMVYMDVFEVNITSVKSELTL